MARRLVHSFIVTAALCSIANAGPCRPSSSLTLSATTTVATDTATSTTQAESTTTETATTGTEETSDTSSFTSTLLTLTTTSGSISESLSSTDSAVSSTTGTTETSGTTESTGSTETDTTQTETSSTGTTETATTNSETQSTGTTDTSASEGSSTTTTTTEEASTTTTTTEESTTTTTQEESTTTTTTEEASTTTTTTEEASTTTTTTQEESTTTTTSQEDSTTTTTTTSQEPSTTTTTSEVESTTTTTTEGSTTTTTTEEASTTTTTSEESTTTTTTTTSEELTTTTTESTTTTTEPAPTCVNNLKNPLPEGEICAKKGVTSGQSSNWRVLGYGDASTLFNCYTACQEKPNCETFAFSQNSFCELYRGTIQDTDGEDFGFEYYVPDCFCDTGIDPAPTCEDQHPITNAGFDTGSLAPWDYYRVASRRPVVDFSIVPGGEGGSAYRFQTANTFNADKSLWVYQDIEVCAGVTFDCTFKWWWDQYYAIRQNDGSSLVPYVRIYQDNDDYALVSSFPNSAADTMQWKTGSFSFTVPASGQTRIWYIASSPQAKRIDTTPNSPRRTFVDQPNALRLDSMVCTPS
ncbi:hypothetical protein FALBO_9513 [Fusarium albosuccineum]|uniref:Apple domain-containing protein n=1 Tax=Fusarium albosuccineum TaxID=1237068 RepID=A0A8H4L7G0_9HYPO|nr:hypothetical protein FALBO_9513 [Fusarium albosuccineum]